MKPKSNPFFRSLRCPISVFTIALSAVTLSPNCARANDWNGSVSTDWNTAGNWSGGIPNGADAVINTITPRIATITGTVPNVGQLLVGTGGAAGRVDHTAGSLTVGSWLVIGSGGSAGGTRYYNLANTAATGGTLTGFGIGSGSLTKTGGGEFYVGENAGTLSVLNINTTGSVTSNSFTAIGANGGTGTVNLDAGSFNTSGWLALGHNGGTGTLSLSGGTVNQGTSDTGSRLELTNPGSTGHATVNLGGTGILAVNGIVASGTGAGNVLLNLDGGTLKANITNNDFINAGNIDRINVRNGGAVIDTNGKDIRITNALLHSNVGGPDSAIDGGLTKKGAGTLTLTNANTFTGAVLIEQGTLYANRGNAAGNQVFSTVSSITVSNGATLRTAENSLFGYDGGVGGAQFKPITINGGSMVLDANLSTNVNVVTLNGGTISGTGSGTYGGFSFGRFNGTAATLLVTDNSTFSSTNASFRNDATIDVSSGKTLAFTGTVTNNADGTSLIKKTGSGTLTLSGANTYTGATTVNAGTLQVSGAGAINGTSGITINGSGAKYLHTSSVAGTKAITLTQGTLDGTGTVDAVTVADLATNVVANGNGSNGALTVGSLTLSGDAKLHLNLGAGAGLIVTNALTTTPANGTVTIDVTKAGWALGSNTLVSYGSLSGALGDFTLGTVSGLGTRQALSGGLATSGNNFILNVTGDLPTWSGANSSVWTTATNGDNTGPNNWATKVAHAGTNFWAADTAEFNDTYNVTGNPGTDVAVTNRTIDIQGANVSPASVTFNNSAGDYTLGSTTGHGIASGSLTKNGSSGLTINTANTYAGGSTLNGGTLNLNNASAIGTGTFTISGGMIDNTTGASITLSTNNAQTWSGDFAFGGTRALNLGTGAVTLGSNRTITTNGSEALTVGGAIGGNFSLTKAGTGTLVLTGVNTFSGGLNINAGVLGANSTDALGVTGTTVTLNGGTLRADATFSTGKAFTMGASGGTFDTNGSNLTLTTAVAGSGALTKTSNGTLTINSNSTFTGNIVVNGGRLEGAQSRGSGNATTSSLGALDTVGRLITLNNASTLALTAGNVLGDGGRTVAITPKFLVNEGSTFTTGGTTSGFWNNIAAIDLNGGAVKVGSRW